MVKTVYLIFMASLPLIAMNKQAKIIIHKDINKTIIAEDPSGEKTTTDVLIHSLAEQYKDKWISDLEKPISYSEYVKEHMFRGNKNDRELKKRRNTEISGFIEHLKSNNHPKYKEASNRLEMLQNKLTKTENSIFGSCYREIEYLTKNKIPYSFILRTFGKDLDRIIKEMHERIAPDFFSWKGVFEGDQLKLESLQSDEKIVLHSTAEIYEFFKTHDNIALQDDWKRWNSNGEKQEFGKLFPIDIHDQTIISYFADDNGNPKDGIVNPRDPQTNKVLDVQALIDSNHICVVDPLAAIEDDEYFVKHLQKLFKKL